MRKEDINIKEVIEGETGVQFNRANSMCCPFHSEKTPSFSLDVKKNRVKCFGSCNNSWDSIAFVMEYRDLTYIEACKYLRIDLPESYKEIENNRQKVEGYIKWQFSNIEERKNWSLDTLYEFVNEENKVLYFKAKFKTPEGKRPSYYRIEGDKVIPSLKNKDGEKVVKEVPYNLYRVLDGISKNKKIFIVEGEKDADTLNKKGYIATSLKGNFSDYDFTIFNNSIAYICGDTGKAGEEYIEKVRRSLNARCSELHIITLPYIDIIGDGDNIDVTDWFEAGHTKEEFEKSISKSLDLLNKYELQQDFFGIRKLVEKFDKDGNLKSADWVYISNFRIKSAKSIRYEDVLEEGIEVVFENQQNEVITRKGEATKFDDVKSFRNFLGTMALTFSGEMKDLNILKSWIYKYFIHEVQKVYEGIQFADGTLITPAGAITNNSIINNIVCRSNTKLLLNNDLITKDELKLLVDYLMDFQRFEIVASILGTIINNMAITHAKKLGIKLSHLLLIGESGSGKSTIKRNVINPLLGYSNDYEGYAMDKITDFALTKSISEGNYTVIFDEYKPSKMPDYRLNFISSTLRNAYDGISTTRGRKDLTTTEFTPSCPVVICGEESYPHSEKALIERSFINYISKHERKDFHVEAMTFLQKNTNLINKLGNTILKYVLELSTEEYDKIREQFRGTSSLTDRLENTYMNACTGMAMLEKILIFYDIKGILFGYQEAIERNIKDNLIGDEENNLSIYEQMLVKFNQLVEDGRVSDECGIFVVTQTYTGIKINNMIDELSKYKKDFGLNYPLLEKSDFNIQAQKGGYITKSNHPITLPGTRKQSKFTVFDKDKLFNLKCYALLDGQYLYNVKNPSNVSYL